MPAVILMTILLKTIYCTYAYNNITCYIDGPQKNYRIGTVSNRLLGDLN